MSKNGALQCSSHAGRTISLQSAGSTPKTGADPNPKRFQETDLEPRVKWEALEQLHGCRMRPPDLEIEPWKTRVNGPAVVIRDRAALLSHRCPRPDAGS